MEVVIPVQESQIETARQFRKAMSPPELRLWTRLKDRRKLGFVIRRQHPIDAYILDFYCREAKLAIEVDGRQHTLDEQAVRDEKRDRWLASKDIVTVRVPAVRIMDNADAVAVRIIEIIKRRTEVVRAVTPPPASPAPPHEWGGGHANR